MSRQTFVLSPGAHRFWLYHLHDDKKDENKGPLTAQSVLFLAVFYPFLFSTEK